MIDIQYLRQEAETFGIQLTDRMLQQFALYAEMLVEWNQKFNLTAITAPEEIVIKHFLDSLTCLLAYKIPNGARLLDIGTGAGFPSVPLLIARPDLRLVAMDSNRKKTVFLNALLESLGLEGGIIHGRAEEWGHKPEFRASFDLCVTRAVSALSILAEYSLPFLRLSGRMIAMKGPHLEEELKESKKAIDLLGGTLREIKRIILPNQSERNLVIIEKESQTSPKFPRPSAKISKQPLH